MKVEIRINGNYELRVEACDAIEEKILDEFVQRSRNGQTVDFRRVEDVNHGADATRRCYSVSVEK